MITIEVADYDGVGAAGIGQGIGGCQQFVGSERSNIKHVGIGESESELVESRLVLSEDTREGEFAKILIRDLGVGSFGLSPWYWVNIQPNSLILAASDCVI